jgi:signal transduction histidine kinase
MSRPFQSWLDSGRGLGLLVYAQFTFDILLITAGLAALPEQSVLLNLQLLLVIIPCALLSRQCGIAMTGLSIAAHLFLTVRRPSVSPVELLGPVYFFAIVAHQCFFYGARLATKTHLAEDESTVSSALLRVADELGMAPTSGALVQRLALLAKEITGASWVAVLLRDLERDTYRIRALISRQGIIDDEVLGVGAPSELALDPRVLEGVDGDCIVVESARQSLLPGALHERWRAGTYLASVLRRDREPLGILLAGFDDAQRMRAETTRRLVVGMARQALLALENARLLEDLQHASTLKSEFISTISHELRSPLHAIIGFTDILREDEPGDPLDASSGSSRHDMLERINVHALHLREMIEATLSVTRIDSGRMPLLVVPTSIAVLLAEVNAEVPDFRRRPEVALDWHVPDGLPQVLCDAGKLKMIVRNLVDNALKFTDTGCVSVTVRLASLGAHRPQLEIEVADTGIGIPPELSAAVFEMYRQADGSLTRRHAGLGLGLYIVKRLVEGQQGTVRLSSVPGTGTTFHVTIPIAATIEPEVVTTLS